MIMRSQYLIQYCKNCNASNEHLILTYGGAGLVEETNTICQICQTRVDELVSRKKEKKKKPDADTEYTVASVFEEDRYAKGRRWIVAEIREVSGTETEYFLVRYPSWGPAEEANHYVSSVTHVDGKNFPHTVSVEIANKLKRFMGVAI